MLPGTTLPAYLALIGFGVHSGAGARAKIRGESLSEFAGRRIARCERAIYCGSGCAVWPGGFVTGGFACEGFGGCGFAP
jgi:hypothetical protein